METVAEMIGYLTMLLFLAVVGFFVPAMDQGISMPVGLNCEPSGSKHGPCIWAVYQTIRAALAEKNMHQGIQAPGG